MKQEITYTDMKKEYEKTQKQIKKLSDMLKVYDRTKIDGQWTSKDGKNAQVCIENMNVQMGILSMIAL